MNFLDNIRIYAFGKPRIRWFALLFCSILSTTLKAQHYYSLTSAMNGTTQTATQGWGYFYDGGGDTGNYTDNENRTITISATWGILIFEFSTFDLESSYDFLEVFDGTSTASPAIHIGSGFTGQNTVNRIISTTSSLTFRFKSDGSANNAGWAAQFFTTGNQDCACRRQVLTNTDFTSGNTTGWTTGIVGTSGTAPITVYTGGPSGNYAGLNYNDQTSATGDYYIEQYWNNVIAYHTYIFSVDAARHAAAGSPRVRLEFYSATNQLLQSTDDYITYTQYPVFTRFSFLMTAPANATKLRVLGLTNGTALKLDNVKLTTCFQPYVTATSPNPATICSGSTVTLSSGLSDPTLTANYQWQWSTSALAWGTWTNISGATSANFTTPALTSGLFYRLVATPTSGTCSAVSSTAAEVTVKPAPTISVTGSSGTFCGSGSVILNATTSGGVTPCTLDWQSSTNGTTWTSITGAANNASYVSPVLTATTYYRAVYTCSSGCPVATSTSATITVKPIPNRPCSITY